MSESLFQLKNGETASTTILISIVTGDDVVVAGAAISAAKKKVEASDVSAEDSTGPDSRRDGNVVHYLKRIAAKIEPLTFILDKASEVQPLAELAWTVLSGVIVVVRKQTKQDRKFLQLLSAMEDAFRFTSSLKSKADITVQLLAYVSATLKQTVDSPTHVIRTLAAKLCAFDARIAQEIAKVIKSKPSITEAQFPSQFKELLVTPLNSIDEIDSEGPIFVIIDGLDELGSSHERQSLLEVIEEQIHDLPAFLRILLVSRREVDIIDVLSDKRVQDANLAFAEPAELHADLQLFFEKKLQDVRTAKKNRTLKFPLDWPGERRIQGLVERAAGLFIWAATVCKFLDVHDPITRLERLLQMDTTPLRAQSALDNLYTTALEVSGDWEDDDFVNSFQLVIGALFAAPVPPKLSDLDALLSDGAINFDFAGSEHTLQYFSCVIYCTEAGRIRLYHPSFYDYLIDSNRCGPAAKWYINKAHHNIQLADICLGYVLRHLHQEVVAAKPVTEEYKTELRAISVDGALPWTKCTISSTLWYACTFWYPLAFKDTTGAFIKSEKVRRFFADDKANNPTGHHTFTQWCNTVGTSKFITFINLLQRHMTDPTTTLDPPILSRFRLLFQETPEASLRTGTTLIPNSTTPPEESMWITIWNTPAHRRDSDQHLDSLRVEMVRMWFS
ncbi:hypothetical protein EUX98_g8272 [Antrodiella citrinella]|uniref:Nephrocystin 3-like N-terminal domain-containing protein n=1 Tax=Antrodiella citrinella TaxID=2447956 RepID=A0A4S4MAM1_9APHY|nr:hypothetical protein EUX98_g8272 [Antrodiella citrinella]